ncbi:hypothetical protein DAEQUDRAFT_183861 [Daedalea quercina L-15889]|uniref:O-methyltransferase domain-containing protein n=1 Tax=Daedalea quercina L-15889 TaxID=1314783 RepID=A0A165RFU9_9APHY|nr:hypothetical protein DAEQUDRAFT_183861 [Daedalea quercina L-15889]
MTFATLRALHAIIGDALDDIENVFRDASAAADPYDALRSPISPSPSPVSYPTSPTTPYSPYSPAPSFSQPGLYLPSPSQLSPTDSRLDSRPSSPAPSFGSSSLSSYSGTGTCSSRASSRIEERYDIEAPSSKGIVVQRMNDAQPDLNKLVANTPPASPVIFTTAAHTPQPRTTTPARPHRKRSNTVTSASNALRRVSNLLGVTSRHGNSSNPPSSHPSPANISSATTTPAPPTPDPAVTPTSTPARVALRPCGGSALDSPPAENPMSPIAFASPTSPPYVSAATPVRKRTGSVTASVSALTRACTAATSLNDSPVTPGGSGASSSWRGSREYPTGEAKNSPSPIRFAPNPNVPPALMSPQTPTSARTLVGQREGFSEMDSPRTPTSSAKDKRRPTPLALLPSLTPTRARVVMGGHEDEGDGKHGQQLPTPASLFSVPIQSPASTTSPAVSVPHTPGRSALPGMGFISSSEVSLSAVGSTPRSSVGRNVPALEAAWEEPASVLYGPHATARKMSVASISVPTPPPSGRMPGGRITPPELDWPSLDEAYYPTQQEEQHSQESKGKANANASSGSPHTPGGPRSRVSPGAKVNTPQGNLGSGDDVAARAKREVEEQLAASPAVLAAVSKLVAACGQICASVQRPFLTVCDAAMGYHLPACMRLLEEAHIPEILREAGPKGMHVRDIARRIGEVRRTGRETSAGPPAEHAKDEPSGGRENRGSGEEQGESGKSHEDKGDCGEVEFGVDPALLSHVLRLLATHHITREVRPDVFANNRISSAVDSGRSPDELMDAPETKYEGTNGIAAFVGLCTDELFKSAAYLADCYLPAVQQESAMGVDSPRTSVVQAEEQRTQPQRLSKDSPGKDPSLGRLHAGQSTSSHASLADLALGTKKSSMSLDGRSVTQVEVDQAQRLQATPSLEGPPQTEGSEKVVFDKRLMHAPFNVAFRTNAPYFEWLENKKNAFRFNRFGRAMTGTSAWEIPGAIIGGFPWHSLPQDSVVVDVGGGIGSTSMLLAHAFPHLRFLVQDRPQVATMGEAAWRDRCPQFLETGRAAFQGHDFFAPQPVWPSILRDTPDGEVTPAVFLLRVITHDWPDLYVTR